MSGVRVLIAEDHPLSREGMGLAARAAIPGASVTGVGTIAAAETAMARTPFRLILLDFLLPDARGFSGFLRLQHRDPTVPIVLVSACEDRSLVEAARAVGAAGYIFKSTPIDDFAAILRRISGGAASFPLEGPVSSAVSAARGRIAELSRAQRRVLMALADGRSNKQIAHDLAVSEATVKAHLTAVFRTIGVTNRAQALLAVGPLFQPGKVTDPA